MDNGMEEFNSFLESFGFNLGKFGFRKDYDYNKRVVKQEDIIFEGEKYFVSTVDLGLNHNFNLSGPPLYYETMIFPENETFDVYYCNRYSEREEALKSHEALVYNILNGNYKIVDGHFEEIE